MRVKYITTTTTTEATHRYKYLIMLIFRVEIEATVLGVNESARFFIHEKCHFKICCCRRRRRNKFNRKIVNQIMKHFHWLSATKLIQ